MSALSSRINNLLNNLLNAEPEVFSERALIVTKAYKETEGEPYAFRQAKALAKILNGHPIVICDGELVVGSKAPMPLGSPIYPEISYEWLDEELDTLSIRGEQPFHISEEVKKILREKVFPYWRGKTVRARLVEALPKETLEAHEAGALFHYYLDRSIGHLVVNYEKVLQRGLNGVKEEIEKELENMNYESDEGCYKKANLLKAMATCIDATISFAKRHAAEAERLATIEKDPRRKEELLEIARMCEWVPANPARTFWEALQSFFFIHLVLNLETNSYAISPGRFDQYMYPYYKKDLKEGKITREFAKELLCCLWIKFNELTVVKSGGTAKQSTTYNDFQNLNIGGLTPDGENAVNELSYLILEVAAELRLPQPNLVALISNKNPEDFLVKAVEVIKLGFGQPALISDEAKTLMLLDKGIPLENARSAAINGCVEIAVPGRHHMASGGYLNLAKCLELALNDGKDMFSGKELGPKTGGPTKFQSFEDLWSAFIKQIEYFVKLKVLYDNIAREVYGEYYPVPFTSMLVDNCIKKGKNFHQYGALYNTPLICPVGVATCADSLVAVKKLVFEERKLSMQELVDALKSDCEGQNGEYTRQLLLNSALKYGNDDNYVDNICKDLVVMLSDVMRKHHNATGSFYAPNIIPTTTHIHFGSLTAATPDGRKSGEPLSEGISPAQGRDINGPTSVIKSVTKLPLAKCYGALLNQKFNPTVLSGESGVKKFAQLWRTFFFLGGYHVQFNILSTETLKDAQAHPEKYRSLIVRVAGYSDYFVRLSKDVQDEIIKRTEHC
jgi:formate C-acetyltransferase